MTFPNVALRNISCEDKVIVNVFSKNPQMTLLKQKGVTQNHQEPHAYDVKLSTVKSIINHLINKNLMI